MVAPIHTAHVNKKCEPCAAGSPDLGPEYPREMIVEDDGWWDLPAALSDDAIDAGRAPPRQEGEDVIEANSHEAMCPDVEALVRAWEDRGTDKRAIWVMLLSTACTIASECRRASEQVCEIVTTAWEAAIRATAVDRAGGVGEGGEA